jgi:hypothetical protein
MHETVNDKAKQLILNTLSALLSLRLRGLHAHYDIP